MHKIPSELQAFKLTVKGGEFRTPKSPNAFDGLLDNVVEFLP